MAIKGGSTGGCFHLNNSGVTLGVFQMEANRKRLDVIKGRYIKN
jgi:hypothetical protein